MNLFSRLSDILACGPNAPWQKATDLESVFARNRCAMNQDVMALKRSAAAIIAVERSLDRELKERRAQKGHEELLRRLEIDYRAAVEDRERVLTILRSVERGIAEVCRVQDLILIRQRAKLAHRRRVLGGTPEGCAIQRRLQRLLDELRQLEEEWLV